MLKLKASHEGNLKEFQQIVKLKQVTAVKKFFIYFT